MKKLVFFLLAAFLSSISPAVWSDQSIQINTGHTQTINNLAYRQDSGELYSVGDDGTLRVWDAADYTSGRGTLLHKLQISHLPIVRIAVHPELPQVALVETDRINTFHLSVWNYETDTELFSHKIEEVPLFLKFSPQGTYLMYGKTEWKSITFLDSRTGEIEPLFEDGFGIVANIFLSSSEKTLLTYSSSGMLRYWNLGNGSEKTSFSTLGDLADIQFSKSGVYMTGIKGSTLYLINLITGTIEAQQRFESIRGYSLDPESDRLVVYFTENSRPRFQSFRIVTRNNSRYLKAAPGSYSAPDFAESPLVFQDTQIFFCRENGDLYTQSIFNSEVNLFSNSVLLEVTDLSMSDQSIVIAGRENILRIQSEAFSPAHDSSSTDYSYYTERFENPINAETGIHFLGSDRFLIYPKSGFVQNLFVFDGFRFNPLSITVSSPVQSVADYEGMVLILEKSGRLRIIDPIQNRELFSYSSFGLQSAVASFDNNIILSRNQTDLINTTLLSVDPETSETVPIPDKNLLTFNLAYDMAARTLYSLGFENRRDSIRTVLKSHRGNTLSRVATLLSYPGEDSEASLAVDPETSRLFTSLGYGDVHMFTWDGFTTLDQVEHIPRKLQTHSGTLYSLNGDSSISMWNTRSGKLSMNLYVFKDLSWVISYSNGDYYAESEAVQYIHKLKK